MFIKNFRFKVFSPVLLLNCKKTCLMYVGNHYCLDRSCKTSSKTYGFYVECLWFLFRKPMAWMVYRWHIYSAFMAVYDF